MIGRMRSAATRSCCTCRDRGSSPFVLDRVAVDRDAERRARPRPAAGSAGRSRRLRRRTPESASADRSRAASCAISGMPSFFTSGKTPAFTGASAGWKPSTVRPSSSPSTVSSRYAFTSSASSVRFGPPPSRPRTAGSACCSAWSTYSSLFPENSWCCVEVEIAAVVNAFDLLEARACRRNRTRCRTRRARSARALPFAC